MACIFGLSRAGSLGWWWSEVDEVSERGLPPVVASIAVVVRDRRVLLVRRANPPDAGRWGFPGGKVERGETMAQAAVRELAEETGVVGEARRIFTAVDAFDYDEFGSLREHFVLVAVLVRWVEGQPQAADDALEARWFALADVDVTALAMSLGVMEVAQEAVALAALDTS